MKTIKIFILLLVIVSNVSAQLGGTKFRSFDNLETALAVAKTENMPVFLDVYASWCTPCKEMDKNVFPDDEVGKYLNSHFIVLKLQVDRTNLDTEQQKKWYPYQKEIISKFDIESYPTFLFIAPNGTLLNKYTGYLQSAELIKLAKESLVNGKTYQSKGSKYFKAIDEFKKGSITSSKLTMLLDELVSGKVGYFSEYYKVVDSLTKTNFMYIRTLPNSALYERHILEFIGRVGVSSSDTLFRLFFNNENKVNRIVDNEGFAQLLIDRVIAKEIVKPTISSWIKNKSHPNWENLETTIKERYNSTYVDRAISVGKVLYSYFNRDGSEQSEGLFHEAFIDLVKNHGPSSVIICPLTLFPGQSKYLDLISCYMLEINGVCWQAIFPSSNNHTNLLSSAEIMRGVVDLIIKKHGQNEKKFYLIAQYCDTYANLLYKSGNADEAITWETIGVEYLQKLDTNKQGIIPKITYYKQKIEMMRLGTPTWKAARITKP